MLFASGTMLSDGVTAMVGKTADVLVQDSSGNKDQSHYILQFHTLILKKKNSLKNVLAEE